MARKRLIAPHIRNGIANLPPHRTLVAFDEAGISDWVDEETAKEAVSTPGFGIHEEEEEGEEESGGGEDSGDKGEQKKSGEEGKGTEGEKPATTALPITPGKRGRRALTPRPKD